MRNDASKPWATWVGYALSAIPILGLLVSASFKLTHSPQVMEMFVTQLGYQASTLLGLALLEITVVVVYAVPRTAVLGAILMTGYLGGRGCQTPQTCQPDREGLVFGGHQRHHGC